MHSVLSGFCFAFIIGSPSDAPAPTRKGNFMNRVPLLGKFALLTVAFGVNACSSDGATPDGGDGPGAGGLAASGGAASGGATSGGAASGGAASGGATSGGAASGGAASGGAASGGAASGGAASGGAASGGAASGGAASGGAASGGAGQTGGASSTGGTSGFSPCKASPCVVLPLGDSITHGFGSSNDAGYRAPLFELAVAANQKVTFIGSVSNGPGMVAGQTFPRTHEGHDGISVTGITGYVPPARAFTATPHIVLLHIGTNDMTSNANPTTTANQLDTLVTNLVEAAPDALIVVAKIVPLGYNNANYDQYIAKIPGIVSKHADQGEHVVMVDMSTLPGSDIKGNGDVHPTDKGYADMADLWYGVIESYLPN
jgi:lysophospholipase L1-like esterase